MRIFRGFTEYKYVCNNCDAEFFEKREENEICPDCKDGNLKNKSNCVSPGEHKDRYYDIRADEYCDNGGKW